VHHIAKATLLYEKEHAFVHAMSDFHLSKNGPHHYQKFQPCGGLLRLHFLHPCGANTEKKY